MSRRFLFFVLLFADFHFGKAQDSIMVVEDTLAIRKMNHQIDSMVAIDPAEALRLAEKQLLMAKKAGWKKGKANAYYNLGQANYAIGNYSLALKYWEEDLRQRKELGNPIKVCIAHLNIGVAYDDMGNYEKALEAYFIVLKMAKEHNMKRTYIQALNNIGGVNHTLGNHSVALKYLFLSLHEAQVEQMEEQVSISLGNISSEYREQRRYSEALKYAISALALDRGKGRERQVAAWTASIAGIYTLIGDSVSQSGNRSLLREYDEKAVRFYNESIDTLRKIGDKGMGAIVLSNMGSFFTERGKYQEAEHYLREAYALAVETGSQASVMDIHQSFYKLKGLQGLPAEALEHFEEYVWIKDSLDEVNNRRNISELQIRYETEKKESENRQLQQQNRMQQLALTNNHYLIGGLGGFILLMILIGFLIHRQNKLQAEQRAVHLEQKLLRTQMNPHFIFNSLASIESFIYEHQPKEAGVYLASFSRLMRLILESSSEEYISLEKEMDILNHYLSLQKLRLDDQLDFTISIGEGVSPEEIRIPPMLTQPFIENAIEHGFRGGKSRGKIEVDFVRKENGLQVTVTDNGVGIEQAQQQKNLNQQHRSMAIQVTIERLRILNKAKRRKLSFEITDLSGEKSGKTGTKVVFVIPLLMP